MKTPLLKEQILKVVFRKIGHLINKNVSLIDIRIGFDHIDKDTFFDAADELVNEKLLIDRGRCYVSLTPDGWDKANSLINPTPKINQNTVNIENSHNSLVQQGIHSHQEQFTINEIPSNDHLQQLLDLLRPNLSSLNLSAMNENKVIAQLATIEAQLMDKPNPTIINEAGRSIKNITEGAIGSLLATAATPGIWAAIQNLLAIF